MTFVVEGGDQVVEQVTKHLHKLIDVIKVSDISEDNVVSRELALIRVKSNVQNRSEIMQVVDIFRANIVDVAPESLIIEVTGDGNKIESLQDLLKGFGILEVMRTGTIAMNRGLESRQDNDNSRRQTASWGEASSV
jgi:acetolactate synthase-1/3 small subunit